MLGGLVMPAWAVTQTRAGEHVFRDRRLLDEIRAVTMASTNMSPQEIQAQLRRQPFIPLRMHMSDGSSYDIRHPELAIVTRTVIMIALYNGSDSGMPELGISCDPLHVTRLEPPAAPAGRSSSARS